MLKVSKIGTMGVFLFCILGVLFAQEEQITITTYFPSPYGSYRDLETQTLRSMPQTRIDIENRFHCTDGTAPNPNCEGLIYYDNGDHLVYYFNGTEWVPLGEAPQAAVAIGGYEKNLVDVSNYSDAAKSEYIYLNGASLVDLSHTPGPEGKSCNDLYGDYARVSWAPKDATHNYVRINHRNFPRGLYAIDWGATIDIDQYIRVWSVSRTKPTAKELSPDTEPEEYAEVWETALTKLKNPPLSVRLYLQFYGSDGWANADYSEYLYDDADPDARITKDCLATDWSDPNVYSTHTVNRTYTWSLSKYSPSADSWRYYRILAYKYAAGTPTGSSYKRNVTFTIYRTFDFSDPTVGFLKPKAYSYSFKCDILVAVRLSNVQMIERRLE